MCQGKMLVRIYGENHVAEVLMPLFLNKNLFTISHARYDAL